MEPWQVIIVVLIIILVAAIPGEIATRRGHRNTTAIKVCGYLGLIIGITWPIALIWSLTDPGPQVLYRRPKVKRPPWEE